MPDSLILNEEGVKALVLATGDEGRYRVESMLRRLRDAIESYDGKPAILLLVGVEPAATSRKDATHG